MSPKELGDAKVDQPNNDQEESSANASEGHDRAGATRIAEARIRAYRPFGRGWVHSGGLGIGIVRSRDEGGIIGVPFTWNPVRWRRRELFRQDDILFSKSDRLA